MSAAAASLSCPLCNHASTFESVQNLRDRLIYISTNKILCPVCQDEVSGLDKLTIHLFTHVKIISMKNCDDIQDKTKNCNSKKFENTVANSVHNQKHMKTSKNKTPSTLPNAPLKYVKIYPKLPVVSLNTVPVTTPRESNQRNLETSSTAGEGCTEFSANQKNTTCNICGLQFVDANILKMHRCIIHNIDENSNQNVTSHQCHLCPKHFKMRGSLMVHLRVAHYGFSSQREQSRDDISMKNDQIAGSSQSSETKSFILERNDNKQWQCDVCRKCFTTKYFLKKHKRLHTGETPYSCTQCNKTFTFQQSYHKHLLYHNDEKPHTCNYCGRAFKELSTLHNHQRIHTGEKPFSCETCGKSFRQRVSYLVHRRIHTGVMPYKCTACEKSFRYKVSQKTHKCPAKPPGTVVRQAGELVAKLRKKHAGTQKPNLDKEEYSTLPTNYIEVSEANAELVLTGSKLSLEDMVSENFSLITDTNQSSDYIINTHTTPCIKENKLNIADIDTKTTDHIDSNLERLINNIPTNIVIDKNIPSPSEILKNLCLSTEDDCLDVYQEPAEDQNYDIYKDFEVFL